MKKLAFLIILALSSISIFAQNANVQTSAQKSIAPNSKILNSAQLLRDIETLSADDMQGRGVETAGGTKAREYVLKRFQEAGIKSFNNSYLQPFEFANRAGKTFKGVNVVGYIEGKKNKDKYIVVTAHYDHVGVQKGEIYNGADDNASGTSALFAIAEFFKKNKPDHTLIFAAFDAEESGLRGARAFVEKPPVAKESLILNINMDMISRNDKNELYAAGTHPYPHLKPTLEAVAKTAKIKLLLGHDRPEQGSDNWTNQSDQGAFHAAKIPFIYFGVEDHADYHKPTDDFAKIQPEFYVRAVETVIAAVKGFDKDLK